MNEDIKLLFNYMQEYINEPNAPDYDGEYPRCWEITTDECKDILNYISVLQQRIDKATNYYYKTLAEYEKENKQMPEESVMMFNLMEGNK